MGQEYVFYGKVQGWGRGRTLISPQSEKVAPDADHPGRIVPVYPLTAGLTQRDMERVTDAALAAVPGDWPDPLPEMLRMSVRARSGAQSFAPKAQAPLKVHHNRGIRTPRRERNRFIGFFCSVFVRVPVSVGIIGENQI